MKWDILNTEAPVCNFCNSTTNQMARFWLARGTGYAYICSDCAKSVKDCMDKWVEIRSPEYKAQIGQVFDSKNIDKVIEENKDKALFPEVNPVCRCGQTGLHPLTDSCRQK